MSADKSIFIKCQCKGEGLSIDYDKKDKLYYFSYWSYGLSNRELSWAERLRYCWKVLRRGRAFNDELILNQNDVNKLENFVISCNREEF